MLKSFTYVYVLLSDCDSHRVYMRPHFELTLVARFVARLGTRVRNYLIPIQFSKSDRRMFR